MKIEVGKFYRMRCGGAVRIEKIEKDLASNLWAYSKDTSWSQKTGAWCDQATDFDLVAEISEVEYNRIVNGVLAGNGLYSAIVKSLEKFFPVHTRKLEWDVLPSTLYEMAKDLEALKSENARLQAQIDRLTGDDAFDRILKRSDKDQRRFKAAKAAMQGLLAQPIGEINYGFQNEIHMRESFANTSVKHADALLKALEETK